MDVKDSGLITKRLDDIRLMESRKSARLVNTDTDFSLLADFNIVEQRKLAQERQPVSSRRRLHSMSDFLDRKRQKNAEKDRREAKRRQRSERQSFKSGPIATTCSGSCRSTCSGVFAQS